MQYFAWLPRYWRLPVLMIDDMVKTMVSILLASAPMHERSIANSSPLGAMIEANVFVQWSILESKLCEQGITGIIRLSVIQTKCSNFTCAGRLPFLFPIVMRTSTDQPALSSLILRQPIFGPSQRTLSQATCFNSRC